MDKEEDKKTIKTHEDLVIYQKAFDAAMSIFELSKRFPTEERYSLTDQIRRSSRSVCANLAEAWRKRWYQDTKAKKGEKRRELDVSQCFAPLLKWILSLWNSEEKWLPLAIDATNIGHLVGRQEGLKVLCSNGYSQKKKNKIL